MITAHKRLGPVPGTYLKGWDLLEDDPTTGEVRLIRTVTTKAEAERIVKAQNPLTRAVSLDSRPR